MVWRQYAPLIMKNTSCKVMMYNGHDIHYIREQRQAELEGKPLEISRVSKKIEESAWRFADYVFYYSQNEVDVVKTFNPEIKAEAIPLYLQSTNVSDVEYKASERNDLMFVGGFAHTPNVDAMTWFIDSIFPTILAKYPDIKLYVVGSNPPDELLKKASKNVIVTGYVTDEELGEIYKKIRLSVVPLRYGAGVKGKIIEAIQNKIPVVTTSIGVEGIKNDSNLITVADTEDDIAKAVIDMYMDYECLDKISSKSEFFIKNNFSIEKARAIFERILR
jgi:glycosyltransferase involved in cell wall biosynthesis